MQLAGGTRRFFFSCFLLTGSHISEVLQENEALKKQVQLVLLQSEQEKEALKADAAQAKQQLCRYSFVVLLLCAFCLFPNASTCTCCLGNVILKAVKQTKYQSSFTVLNFYP